MTLENAVAYLLALTVAHTILGLIDSLFAASTISKKVSGNGDVVLLDANIASLTFLRMWCGHGYTVQVIAFRRNDVCLLARSCIGAFSNNPRRAARLLSI